MIEKLIHTLNNIGLTITAEEIADILWLASNLDEPELSEKPETRTSQDQTDSHADIPKADVRKSGVQDKPVKSLPEKESAKTGVYPPEPEDKKISDSGIGGLPFRSPAASALPGQLAIERALRPLMRKVPSRNRFVLDEEATVRQIAESDNWLPVMRPEPSRWLDVILLADESPSMVIWQQTISELKFLLERQGAFRNVQVWGFDTQENQIRLHAGTGFEASQNLSRNPKELIDPSGKRLILVISDCVSKAWHDGRVAQMMAVWENSVMIAIVQMLPHWLWERTGLDYAESVYLRALSPGTVNAQLEIEQSDDWFDEKPSEGLRMPVITLESLPMSSWAKSVAGMGSKWIPGVVLTPPSIPPRNGEGSFSATPPALLGKGDGGLGQASPEEQLRLFRATASPAAQQLAGYLAAVPLTLPIMRLVQRVMMPPPESSQIHLAEVFLSGLIKKQNDSLHPDMVRYEFVEGIRDILLSSNLISETVNVISRVFEEVSAFIDKNTGKPLDFRALVADPSLSEALFAKDRQAFAFISAHVLSRLGGKYAELARILEKQESAVSVSTRRKHADTFINSISMKFVYIPPGEFMMGSPPDEPGRFDDEILHKVTLTKGFYMQTTQVTQKQWQMIMGDNPSHFKNDKNCPVEQISWDDAQEFIRKLNEKEGTDKYRLPTEAEWEYACRAGTTTPFHFGKCLSTDQANYNGNYPLEGCPKGEYRKKTVPVGSFAPNAWGLYEMHGNVWEWCHNWYGEYTADAATDPLGPSSGSGRVLRGGGWFNGARNCRTAARDNVTPGNRYDYSGFRLVCPQGQ